MPGPAPQPTKLRALRGNPGKRGMRKGEAKPPTKIPRCPAHLDAVARKEWRRISKLLALLGLISEIDRAALAGYCQVWARWVEAEEQLRRFGTVIKSPNGYPILSPYLTVANRSLSQMRQFLGDFGMTPAARTRIEAGDGKQEQKKGAGRFFSSPDVA